MSNFRFLWNIIALHRSIRWRTEMQILQTRTQVRYITHRLHKWQLRASSILYIGPGTYAQEKVKIVGTVKDMMSNSFSTKVSRSLLNYLQIKFLVSDTNSIAFCRLQIPRFCPTAPGSSIYKPPTYLTNPDPGCHVTSLKFMGHASDLDQSRSKYLSNRHRDQINKLRPKPASIPSKKVNVNMYTGRG